MRPAQPDSHRTDDLFRARLDQIIDMRHELVQLAGRIDWQRLDDELADAFSENGRPALPTRFVVGLFILKHVQGLSDEEVCQRWVENPYFQYFTGETYFQHTFSHERSSLSHWRKRVADKLDRLLAESLNVAFQAGALAPKDLARVSVDTTVQPKNIAHPTDAGLMLKALQALVAEAKAHGIGLRQSYARVAKRAAIKAGRYAHARQFRRMAGQLKFLRVRLGRVIRDIRRKIGDDPVLREALAPSLTKAARIVEQQRRQRGRKLYSWHAPEVECIGKGKARQPYEFGVKVSLVTTNRRAKGGQFVLHCQALPGAPYDGHTLGDVLDATEALTGRPVERAYVDKGYRGHDARREHRRVYHAGLRRGIRGQIKRELRRRSAIEAVIGHMKSDGHLDRNYLKGAIGDRVNAVLTAVGHNFRLILNWIKLLLALISDTTSATFEPPHQRFSLIVSAC